MMLPALLDQGNDVVKEEKYPEHAEKADSLYGVIHAQRSKGNRTDREQQTVGQEFVFLENRPQALSASARDQIIQAEQSGKNKDFGFPQLSKGGRSLGGQQLKVTERGPGQIIGAQQRKSRADGKTDDHGPAGQPKELFPLQIR